MPAPAPLELAASTAYAARPITPLVAEIRTTGDEVLAHLPTRHDVMVKVCRDLGMGWKGWAWRMHTSDPVSTAAELGHALLFAGISIRASQEVLRRAVAAEFSPRATRWVKVITKPEQHSGWFGVSWARRAGEDWWKEARALPGARYLKPLVAVPPDAWREVADFAETHDFEISESAAKLIEAMKAAEATSIRVQVQALPPKPKKRGRPKLDIMPPADQVPADLRDDP
jgi:hypothetical protein